MTPRTKLLVAAAVAVAGTGVAAAANSLLSALARKWVPAFLSERFASDVEIRSVKVAVFPRPSIRAEGVVFRRRGRRDLPPLITMAKFSARIGLLSLVRAPRRIRSVHIEGLHIQVPPKEERLHEPAGSTPKSGGATSVVVDEIVSENARLDLYPTETGKPPRTFLIPYVLLRDVAAERPWPFEARLTNPKPQGDIETQGEFGPWNADEPGQTPLNATYTFKNANLDTICGLAGTLSSTGRFGGVLERIDVNGSTETPDFSVDIAGHNVSLHTDFHAIVDGTTGDTILKPVTARFLDCTILADGAVKEAEGGGGRRVTMDVTVRDARVEDLLKLAIKGDTPLTGRISFRTRFELPPGEEDLVERLRLAGEFGIFNSQFTKLNVSEKIRALSRKGQGEPENPEAGSTVSNFTGRFTLKGGVATFPDLRFRVAGAEVYLKGTYGLENERLDFRGNLRLEKTVSEATSGWKSTLLKLVDPLFRKKGAGAVIPIKVEGTRSNPQFGLDAGRVF